MRRLPLLLLLLAAGARAADAPPPAGFGEATRRELSAALACLDLSLDDLAWDKRPIDDDWRLSVVNETLDHPLQLAVRAEQAERDFGGDARASVLAASRWLDAPQDEAALAAPAPGKPPRLQAFPAGARALLADALAARARARAFLDAASAGLTADERAVLARSGARLYADESEEEWDTHPVMAAAKKMDVRALVASAVPLAELAAEAQAGAADLAKDGAGWRPAQAVVDGVKVEVGGPGDDVHRGADLVIDPGGDDRYEGCGMVIDLRGDDLYRDAGGGLFGAGLVVDVAGNDRYLGGNFTEGGAAFGSSLLVDAAGDDRYEADQVSQGAAFYGVGILLDLAGNDAYRGARFVQGFGGVKGLGLLADRSGQDQYYAGGKYSHAPLLPENFQSLSQGFGFGMRPDVSGGVGVLLDSAGNDSYTAEVFGQGASYWFALGILVDSAGHDKYDLYQYGQGAGIHLSPGVLMDRAGNDAYSCNNGVAQGSGHDWGVGLLWDRAGNDYYQGSGMSQGGANANGIGMIVDEAGNDAYSGTGEKNQGDSFFARGTIGLGLLLDMAGKDRYTHGGADGVTWTRGTVGVGRDVPDEAKP